MNLRLFCLLWSAVFLLGCAGTSSRLLAPAHPPLRPDQVEIYRTAPAHYERLANLDASSGAHFFHGNQRSDAEAIARLQEAAAKVGANGVLLTLVGDEPTGAVGLGFGGGGYGSRSSGFNGEAAGSAPLVQTTAHGIAIFVLPRR